jgi:RNA polymerase sigma factor (sigma-70 family)
MTSSEALMHRALEWVIAISDPECPPSQLVELDQWLAADPENERIFWAIDAALETAAGAERLATLPFADSPKSESRKALAAEHQLGGETSITDKPDPSQSREVTGQRVVARMEERYLLQALEFEGVLRACLYRYTRNNSDVDDLLHEVYARLLIAGGTDEPEVRSVRAFAFTIARNVAFDWLRDRQIVPIELVADLEAVEMLDEGDQLQEIVESQPEIMAMIKAIEGLPDRCRQVFILCKVYGYSQKEIAVKLAMSERAVEHNLTRAARSLAHALFEGPHASERLERLERQISLPLPRK